MVSALYCADAEHSPSLRERDKDVNVEEIFYLYTTQTDIS